MEKTQPIFIRIKNLIKVYGDEPKKALKLIELGLSRGEIKKQTGQFVCLNDLSFDIHEGEIFVIMGLSGSGKSTLLRSFNGLSKPTRGTILVNGTDIAKLSARKLKELRREQITMVFQNFALFPHRTLVENVEFGLEINHVPPEIRREQALSALDTVKLKNWANFYPHQVSGGMQQRVGLARSLVLNPKIILMDEAFSALDPMIRSDMQDDLMDLQKRLNNTIIFVCHDLDEALKIATRILILKDGRIMQCGTPEEILLNPSNEYIEKFVKNADVTKYLSASSLMEKPRAVENIEHGPSLALYKMDRAGLSKMYILDKERRSVMGYVTIEEVANALNKNEKDLKAILRTDHVAVKATEPISDLMKKSLNAPLALAVLSDYGELLGVITRSHLIAGLTKKEVVL